MLFIVAHLHIFALVPTCHLLLHVHCLLALFLPICCIFMFLNTFSCCSHLLIAFSKCFRLLVAFLCYLALAQQCLMYPLKHKLPPHWCFKYPSKFKLLAHHLLVIVVVCLLFPFVWYFPFLVHVGCGMRRWSIINVTSFFKFFFLVFLFVCTLDGLEEAESQGKDFLWYPKRNWSPCLGTSKALNIFKNWSKLMKLWSLENSRVKNLKRKISQHLKGSNQIEKHSLDLVMLPLAFKDEF